MSTSRSLIRINFARAELTRLRNEIVEWLTHRRDLDGFQQYRTQLDALEICLYQILTALDTELGNLAAAGAVRVLYQKCRDIETKTIWTRQVWRFYADKFDQRDAPDTGTQLALKAADEAVWSCFAGVYKALPNVKRPAAPLPYLEPLYSPYALPRDQSAVLRNRVVSAPFMQEFLGRLPIPTIGLSEGCSRAPWWLIYIGHEVGHHLQHDLLTYAGLVEKFRECLQDTVQQAVAKGTPAPPNAAERWATWGEEVFADAVSIYSLGPRAAWAIAELVMGDDVAMLKESDRYPPAAVRLALMSQLPSAPPATAALALADIDLDALFQVPPLPDDFGKDLRALARDHHGLTPGLAAAIDTYDCGGLGRLRTLCRWQDSYFRPGGDVEKWRNNLRGTNALELKPSLDAPRLILSGGLAAWAEIGAIADPDERKAAEEALAERMCNAMIDNRETGKRSAQAAPAPASLEELSARFAQVLLARPAEELDL